MPLVPQVVSAQAEALPGGSLNWDETFPDVLLWSRVVLRG